MTATEPERFDAAQWAATFIEWRTARNLVGDIEGQPEDIALANLLQNAYNRGRSDLLAGQLNAVERVSRRG